MRLIYLSILDLISQTWSMWLSPLYPNIVQTYSQNTTQKHDQTSFQAFHKAPKSCLHKVKDSSTIPQHIFLNVYNTLATGSIPQQPTVLRGTASS